MTRAELLMLGCRCTMRVEAWAAPNASHCWKPGLEHVVRAMDSLADFSESDRLRREVSNCGASAGNRLLETDAPLGICINSTMQTLAQLIEATTLTDEKELKKAIIKVAKFSGNIPATLIHAKRITPSEEDPDAVYTAIWDAIRADIPIIREASAELASSQNLLDDLRGLGDVWHGRPAVWDK